MRVDAERGEAVALCGEVLGRWPGVADQQSGTGTVCRMNPLCGISSRTVCRDAKVAVSAGRVLGGGSSRQTVGCATVIKHPWPASALHVSPVAPDHIRGQLQVAVRFRGSRHRGSGCAAGTGRADSPHVAVPSRCEDQWRNPATLPQRPFQPHPPRGPLSSASSDRRSCLPQGKYVRPTTVVANERIIHSQFAAVGGRLRGCPARSGRYAVDHTGDGSAYGIPYPPWPSQRLSYRLQPLRRIWYDAMNG